MYFLIILGVLRILPFYQELTGEQKNDIKSSTKIGQILPCEFSDHRSKKTHMNYLDYKEILQDTYQIPYSGYTRMSYSTESTSNTSIKTVVSKKSTSLLTLPKHDWKPYISVMSLPIQYRHTPSTGLFGIKETSVYMTLSDNFYRRRTSGTQATASINKCFQVSNGWLHSPSTVNTNSDYCSTCTMSTLPHRTHKLLRPDNLVNPSIYFFGRKKDENKQKGMGSNTSQRRPHRTNQTSTHALRTSSTTYVEESGNTQTAKPKFNLPAKSSKGTATASGTSKTVTIKDNKQLKPCPALGTTKGDMMVTVSHIRIGPKETCPVHGNEPCLGPKCILASSGEEQGPVKVTSVNNARRGVFEVVIRKLTGAPLAKNELMLEWTPPPSRSQTCSGPCPIPCLPSGSYRPSKLIVCRPSPCRPKYCKKKPCGPVTCRPTSCKRIPRKKCCKTSCRGTPCNRCKLCPPPSCCPSSPCANPCSLPPCGRAPCTNPCKSSPCLRLCPVGQKRPRMSRSQPKIKAHRKRISSCCNISRTCPVVRCRSVSGPSIGFCGVPPYCLPRKSCSVLLCKTPKLCTSACSTCCG